MPVEHALPCLVGLSCCEQGCDPRAQRGGWGRDSVQVRSVFLSGCGASGSKCDAEIDTVVSSTPQLVFRAG